jgi:ankyrin repeat protein
LSKGGDANLINNRGYSAMVLASKNNKLELVKLLLDKGADIENSKSKQPVTPLGMSIKHGNRSIYDYLIRKEADINKAVFSTKESYLSVAIINNQNSIAWDLINRGVDIEIASKNGLKALHHAIAHEKDSLVTYLIDKTENLESIDPDGKTALNYAIETHNHKALDYLIERTQINRRDYNGWSPLHYSILLKDTVAFKKLLDKEANPDVYTFNDSISPLLVAAKDELDYFIIPMLKKTDNVDVPLNSPEMYYYSAYLHWRKAQVNKNVASIYTKEKAIALANFNIALKGFKSQISTGRWKKMGIVALNALAIAAANFENNYRIRTSQYGYVQHEQIPISMVQPGIEYGKSYRDKCERFIQLINSSK